MEISGLSLWLCCLISMGLSPYLHELTKAPKWWKKNESKLSIFLPILLVSTTNRTSLYFVDVNNIEEINNEIKQKTRKCASNMKKPKNVTFWRKQRKEMRCDFSPSLSKVKCCNYVFRYFGQNGTFFREMSFAVMFFRFFRVFRC